MPVRSQSRSMLVEYQFWDYDNITGQQLFTGKSTQKVNTCSWTEDTGKSGVSNPAYQFQIAHHIDATTAFSARRKTVDVRPGSATSEITTVSGGIRRRERWMLKGILPVTTTDNFTADLTVTKKAADDARDKAYAQIRALTTPASAGVFLGELREAIHMVRNPAAGLSRLILGEQYSSTKRNLWAASRPNAKRRKSPASKKQIKRSVSGAMAESWLENSFGWQPFISDIKSGAVALAKLNADPQYIPFRVTGKASGQPVIINNGDWSTDGFVAYTETLIRNTTAEKHYYGEVCNSLANPNGGLTAAIDNLSRYTSAFGLTKAEFIPTVWELIPFSFLVDYFSNVGDILSQCAVDIGKVNRLSSTRVFQKTTRVMQSNFRCYDTRGKASGGMPDAYIVDKTVDRTPGFDLVPASLRFELPGVSSRKWMNIGALITTQWAGMGRNLSKRLRV